MFVHGEDNKGCQLKQRKTCQLVQYYQKRQECVRLAVVVVLVCVCVGGGGESFQGSSVNI